MATRPLLLSLFALGISFGIGSISCKGDDDDADPTDIGTVDQGPKDTGVDSGTPDSSDTNDGGGSTDAVPGEDAAADDRGRVDTGPNEGPGVVFRVFELDGDPVEGATVDVGGASYTTGDDGIAFITGLSGDQVFTVSRAGFVTTPFGYSLPDGRLQIDTTLLPEVAPTALDDAVASMVLGATAIATFGADTVQTAAGADISGAYEARLLPVDPSVAVQVLGAPLPFRGVDLGGNERSLEVFSIFDMQVSQNGTPLVLKSGQTARMELVVPPAFVNLVQNGETVEAWSYDVAAGRWREELDGTVADAAFGQRVWTGDFSHFSWWAVARSFDPACLEVRTTGAGGVAVESALVRTVGIDHGFVGARFTDGAGDVCLDIKPGGSAGLSAIHERYASLVSQVVVTGNLASATCGGAGCGQAPLELVGPACAGGAVLDGQGAPYADARVQIRYDNSSGQAVSSFTTSDAQGEYCALGASDGAALVTARDGALVDSSTVGLGAGDAVCGQSCASPGDLILADFVGGCVRGVGEIYNGMNNPIMQAPPGTPVYVYSGSAFQPSCATGMDDPATWGALEQTTTVGVNGAFCVSAIPLGPTIAILGDCTTWASETCGPVPSSLALVNRAVCGQSACNDLGNVRFNLICDGS